MTGIYQAYLAKTAADEGFDPILQHPNLAAKPKNLDEMSERKMRLQTAFSTGGAVGGLAGLGAAALYAKRRPEVAAQLGAQLHAGGALGGVVLGATVGGALTKLRGFVDKVHRHDAAAKHYEAATGQALPWDVRHPHLANAGLYAGTTGAGALLGKALTAKHPELVQLGPAVGSVAGSLAGQALHPYLQQRRNDVFKGRVNQQQLAESALNEDKLDEEAMRS